MRDVVSINEVVFQDKPLLIKGLQDIDLKDIDIQVLDKPVVFDHNSRSDLEPLSDEAKEMLGESGYSEKTIDAIGSKEEALIYCEANLTCIEVNDNDALVRNDIDYEQKDVFGDTNLERMEKGKAPLDTNGKPIELHHIGQKPDSPLAELTRSEHTGNGNDTVLHDKQKESEIDRLEFAKERGAHWKARAEDINRNLLTQDT